MIVFGECLIGEVVRKSLFVHYPKGVPYLSPIQPLNESLIILYFDWLITCLQSIVIG